MKGHNENAIRLSILIDEAIKGALNAEKGEEFAIGGWLAYGHALNEARSLFDSDRLFGEWINDNSLRQVVGVDGAIREINDHERASAMWAAANADQFEEARQRGNPRTIRGIHAKWKEIEAEREAEAFAEAQEIARKEAAEKAERDAAQRKAEEAEAREAAKSAETDEERVAAQAKLADAINARKEAEASAQTQDPKEEVGEVEPDAAPDPYGYAKLTEEALLDLANGLRADLEDARAELAAIKAERDDLKAQLRDATEGDQGATIGRLARQISTLKEARNDALAKAAKETRRANFLANERDDLRKRIEAQEVEI